MASASVKGSTLATVNVQRDTAEHPHLQLLVKAVSLVLEDDGFSIPSASAKKARESAQMMLQWIRSNQAAAVVFACNLIQCLESCFRPPTTTSAKSLRLTRERMWESFYKFRSSTRFVEVWSWAIRESTDGRISPTAIYYQFVTDAIMEDLIKVNFPVESSENEVPVVANLTYKEVNALRYTAGYTIRALESKLERQSVANKELILCLSELNEVEEGERESESWTNAVDRGGLYHVGEMTFLMFESMEMELRKHLSATAENTSIEAKEMMTTSVRENEDVLFFWSLLSADWSVESADALLKMIVEHWTVVRGFSYVSAFLEKYKQDKKKTVQKSKGLRKTLPSTIGSSSVYVVED